MAETDTVKRAIAGVRPKGHGSEVPSARLPDKTVVAPPLHPDAWPEMTQAAREARVLNRLADPRPWRAKLKRLAHHDPEYVYDIGHEYETDWTTDPDYATDGIHLYEFDGNGFLHPRDKRHDRTRDAFEDAAESVLDNRVETEVEPTIPEDIAEKLELKTKEDKLKETVRPDLMVLAPGFNVPVDDRILRLHRGHPSPELVLEILSKTTADKDLDEKFRLYEALGVSEYLLYDLGGKRSEDSPAELLMYRLMAPEVYEEVPSDPKLSETGMPAFASEVFGQFIRMQVRTRDDGEPMAPQLQWYDEDWGLWRDPGNDRLREARTEASTQGETAMAIKMLRSFLAADLTPETLAYIAAAWQTRGLPTDVADRMRDTVRKPRVWRTHLTPPGGWPDRDPN